MGSPEHSPKKSRQQTSSFQLQGVSAERRKAFFLTVLGAFLVIRGGMFLLNPQLASLECDRRQAGGMCKFVVSSLQGETVTPLPLHSLKKAVVQRRGKSKQLILLTSDQTLYFPLNNWFNSAENTTYEVNAFLQDANRPTLKVKQDSRWVFYSLGLTLILLGGALLWVYTAELLAAS